MLFLIAVAAGLCFGAADQYLGSLFTLGFWTVSASLLSAPWLVLPFVFGCRQVRAGRAAVVGLVVTLSALSGYFLMVMSPFEGGRSSFDAREVRGLLASNALNIVGGLVTGPLYGFLGQRWRTRRAWTSAVLVAGALCLEPLAVVAVGRGSEGSAAVWAIEIACGIAAAVFFLARGRAYRHALAAEVGKASRA